MRPLSRPYQASRQRTGTYPTDGGYREARFLCTFTRATVRIPRLAGAAEVCRLPQATSARPVRSTARTGERAGHPPGEVTLALDNMTSPGSSAESMSAPPRRQRPSRVRSRGLAADIVLVLAAAMAGLGVAAITSGRSHWLVRPPLAELTVTDGTTSEAWQAVPPLESTWRSNRDGAAPAPGQVTGSWARIGHWRATGKTVLFLQIPQRPDLILLLRYQRLTPAGTPDGSPRRMQCSAASRCSETRCTRHGAPGECVVMDNLGYRDGTAVVVVVGWPESAASPSGAGQRGPATEYASWGFVANPSSERTSAAPGTGRLQPRRAHAMRSRVSRELGSTARVNGAGSRRFKLGAPSMVRERRVRPAARAQAFAR
jgi:hypothetical protein